MNFEWKLEKNKELSFEDKVHNLACFEIVVNILRMKTRAGDDDVGDEMEALCGFALDCMFKGIIIDDDMFESIMELKDKAVYAVRAKMLKASGIPEGMLDSPSIGEA